MTVAYLLKHNKFGSNFVLIKQNLPNSIILPPKNGGFKARSHSVRKANYPNATFQGEDNAEQNSNKNSQEKVFSGLFYKVIIAIQQSHILNPLLTSFARSVRESIAFGFYRTDLAPSSLGLYENLRQYFPVQTSHSVNKSLISTRVEIGKTRNCAETRRPKGGVFSHNFEFFQFSRVLI